MDEEMKKAIDKYHEKREHFLKGGTPKAVERQHAAGKLTARERVTLLLDPASFVEYDLFIDRHPPDFGMADVDESATLRTLGQRNGRNFGLAIRHFEVHDIDPSRCVLIDPVGKQPMIFRGPPPAVHVHFDLRVILARDVVDLMH